MNAGGTTMREKIVCRQTDWWWVVFLLLIFAIQILGLYFFTFGFFPMKVTVKGHATLDDFPTPVDFQKLSNTTGSFHPLFGRLVVMVVDALSAPLFFGNSSAMNYSRGLIAAGTALPFIAQAQAPTVTLPRIKALTSGSIPTFLDFLFNFGGQALAEDNLITQFRRNQKRLVFYGDDTWLKLFPDHFHRFEGTTSFFVADTVEVDNNVTRNVWPELEKDDWDVMILHFLGLDHVGHLEGPHSRMMRPKQQEMDGIVERIHKKLIQDDTQKRKGLNAGESLPTLFLLCSDHGMNEMGNHGGSSLSETSSIFIFMSSLFEPPLSSLNSEAKGVSQIDLAPTLSLLFGQPIPRNSLGSLIAPLLSRLMEDEQYLRALQINAEQLLRLVKAGDAYSSDNTNQSSDAEVQQFVESLYAAQGHHKEWLQAPASEKLRLFQTSSELYLKFISGVKGKLSGLMSSENDNITLAGVVVLFLVSAGSITLLALFLWGQYKQNKEQEKKQRLSAKKLLSVPHRFIILGSLLHIASLAGSSMVEEEHQTWYFLTTSLHVLYLWESVKGCFALDKLAVQKSVLYFGVLVFGRVERGWNQTGIKWLGQGDFGKWLMEEEHLPLLHCLNFVALCAPCIYAIFILERCRSLNPKLRRLCEVLHICGALVLLSYRFKVIAFLQSDWLPSDIWEARLVYFIVISLIFIPFLPGFFKVLPSTAAYRKFADLRVVIECWTVAWLLLLQLVHRYHNIFLFLIIIVKFKFFISALTLHKRQYVMKNKYTTIEKDISLGMMAFSWMGAYTYFALGNSNSVSSMDISGAYTGLTEYHPVPVAILTFIITFSGPFLSVLSSSNFVVSYFEELEIWQKGLHTNYTKLIKMEGTLFRSFSRMNILMGTLWLALHSLHLLVFALLMGHFRHHLFVWSVFAPKFIYFLFWTIFEACKYLFLLVSFVLFFLVYNKRKPLPPTTPPTSPRKPKDE